MIYIAYPVMLIYWGQHKMAGIGSHRNIFESILLNADICMLIPTSIKFFLSAIENKAPWLGLGFDVE